MADIFASGEEITLHSGDYDARIVTVGAGLAGLTFHTRDLVLPHQADEVPPGYSGKVVMPWANRISNARYQWQGETYELPCNEHALGTALHGFMSFVNWTIEERDDQSVTLSAFVAPRYEYPWGFQSSVSYALDADSGLSITMTSRNVSHTPAPYGVTIHPYLTAGGATCDDMTLTLPADKVLEYDQQRGAIALHNAGDMSLDARQGLELIGRQVDHAFTGLPANQWMASLSGPDGFSVTMTSNTKWVQVYTGDGLNRVACAVEPMMSPPDALNTKDDLVILEPRESHTMAVNIRGHREL